MKIENNGINVPAPPNEELRRPDESGSAVRPPSTGANSVDHLELSTEGQIVRSAAEMAYGLPDIRHSLVERMIELNSRGEIGQDAGRLANAIIDHWLTTP
jgi:hypothetical protein